MDEFTVVAEEPRCIEALPTGGRLFYGKLFESRSIYLAVYHVPNPSRTPVEQRGDLFRTDPALAKILAYLVKSVPLPHRDVALASDLNVEAREIRSAALGLALLLRLLSDLDLVLGRLWQRNDLLHVYENAPI